VDTSIVLKDRSASIVQQQYAWIDVFPLDGMPNNQIKLKIHSFRLLLARMIFNYSIFSSGVDMNAKNRPWYEKVLIRFGQVLPVEKIFNRQKAYIRLDRLLKMYDFDESNYLINLMGAYKLKEMFHKKYFGNGAKYEFEGMQLNGPKDYNYVLTQLYGDYMTPPPIGDRNHHRIEIVK
ncbi:MAG: LicD family protein, partial [Tissierellia bacterium]|nr:LicD family protein [Tissierellia bacterium]